MVSIYKALIVIVGLIATGQATEKEAKGLTSSSRSRTETEQKQNKKRWRVLHPKQDIRVDPQTETTTTTPSSEMSIDNSLPKEKNELDYGAEHERVKDLIETGCKGGKSLNLDNRMIFSLPNKTSIMKKPVHCEYINFSENKIDALPDEIYEWTSSTSLDLSQNNFTIAPWQVFTIGINVHSKLSIVVQLWNNPIKRIPDEFFETMMAQKDNRKPYQGFSITLDQAVIEALIIPKLETWSGLKTYLVDSFHCKITNGFCTIQTEYGQFLSFDHNGTPGFASGENLAHH